MRAVEPDASRRLYPVHSVAAVEPCVQTGGRRDEGKAAQERGFVLCNEMAPLQGVGYFGSHPSPPFSFSIPKIRRNRPPGCMRAPWHFPHAGRTAAEEQWPLYAKHARSSDLVGVKFPEMPSDKICPLLLQERLQCDAGPERTREGASSGRYLTTKAAS